MTTTLRRLTAAAVVLAAGGVAFVALPPQSPAVAAVAAQDTATVYKVDAVHSTVVFSAMYGTVAPFYGQFTEYKGTIAYDGKSAASLKVDVEIPMDSIDTHNAQRDGHLKSPDWFNAREYPTIAFKSSGVTGIGNEKVLKGDLTLHGVTKRVVATISHVGAQNFGDQRGNRAGLACTFKVKRSDFGVSTMMGDNGIGDEITLTVGLQGTAE